MNPQANVFYQQQPNETEKRPLSGAYDNRYAYDKEVGYHHGDVSSNYRLGFLQKVYTVIIVQMLLACLFISFNYFKSLELIYIQQTGLFIASVIVLTLLLIFLILLNRFAKFQEISWILLVLITISQCWILGYVAALTETTTVLFTCILIIAVTLSLLIYTWCINTEFHFWWAFLVAFLTLVVALTITVLIVLSTLASVTYLNFLLSGIAVLLYTFYIIFDSQLILTKVGIEYSWEDHIFATLNVYINACEIFSDFFHWMFAGCKC